MKKATPTNVVEAIEVGEVYRDVRRDETFEWTAAEPCDEKNRGQWVCVTHGQVFRNQLEKDSHIGRGSHRLGWICYEHGLEKP